MAVDVPLFNLIDRHSRGQAHTSTTVTAECERLRGALSEIGPRGVSLAVDPIWGSVTPPCADAIRAALSSRAASSRHGEHAVLSCGQPRLEASRTDAVSCTARGLLQYDACKAVYVF